MPARHMRETEPLNLLSPIHAPVIHQIPRICQITEFSESFAPFRKNYINARLQFVVMFTIVYTRSAFAMITIRTPTEHYLIL